MTSTKRPDGGELIERHHYNPSTLHMGDCSICGNVYDAPLHIGSPSEHRASHSVGRTPTNESPAPQPQGLREDVKRWKLVDGKMTTGESVIFDGAFIVAKVTRREDAELILAALASPSLTAVGWQCRWQNVENENWGEWYRSKQTEQVFRDKFAYELQEGTCQIRYLYAAPATLIEQSGQK